MYQNFYALAQDIADMEIDDAMTNLRLQKTLYYAQGLILKRHGIALFSETIEDPPPDTGVQCCRSCERLHRCGNSIRSHHADPYREETKTRKAIHLTLISAEGLAADGHTGV